MLKAQKEEIFVLLCIKSHNHQGSLQKLFESFPYSHSNKVTGSTALALDASVTMPLGYFNETFAIPFKIYLFDPI